MQLLGEDKDVLYDYDFSGNVVLRHEIDGPGTAGSQRWSFEYDGTNQQREVLFEDGTGGRELYYYDSAGQRYVMATSSQSAFGSGWGALKFGTSPIASKWKCRPSMLI